MTKVFFGGGEMGLRVLQFCRTLHIEPDYFCDNDREKWGKRINGILVISPTELKEIKNAKIYITCFKYEDILQQLLSEGINRKNIIIANLESAVELLLDLEGDICNAYNCKKHKKNYEEYECLIDLRNGMGLGGVERFCFDLAKNMVKWGIKASYVGFQYETHSMMDNTLPYYGIDNRDGYFLLDCMEFMIESKAKYIIANYSLEFMQAASIVKKHYNPSLKIVGIIHCEDEIPFQQYRSRWDDIDLVWAISSRIEKRLLECGVSKEKINKLTWHIQVPPMEKREYSKEGTPIKVGYAGRIEKEQKRMDYIVPIAMALKKKNVKFKLQIAGTGAYEEELKKQILSHGLNQEIELLGLVEHDKILDFWLKQDVCLSCSDFEGHSITHSEAIAVGAVPVLTNTSGAEDDVIDGETGYIVDIGDFEAIADKIAILYQDKRRLKTYGRKILELKQKNSYQKQCEQYETWKKFFSY